jgi:FlaA1/EpsC-like NDP-sugar epimerase
LRSRVEQERTRRPDLAATPAREPSTTASAARRYRRLVYGLATTDLLAVTVALGLGAAWFSTRSLSGRELGMLAVAPPIALLVFRAFRVYAVHRVTPAEEFRRLVSAITIWIGLVVTLSFWADVPLTRSWIAATWLLSLALVLGSRRLWHLWIGHERAHGGLAFRTLVVGTNEEAERLVHSLRETRGYEPIAFVSPGNGLPRFDGLPVVGTIDELAKAIATTGSECVLVAASAVTTEQMRRVSRIAHRRGVELRVSANLPEVLWPRRSAA